MIVIRHKENHGAWLFDNAKDAALFMWGKDFKEYSIFVAHEFHASSADVSKLEKGLHSALVKPR